MTIACTDTRRPPSDSPRSRPEMWGACTVRRFDGQVGYRNAV